MNEKEKLMYDILARISDTDTPLVFKGALITKLILEENGYKQYQRATKDVDANWIDTPPTMSSLTNILNASLGELSRSVIAVPVRVYKENQSAGIAFVAKDSDNKLFSMDIDIKPIFGSRTYYYGNAEITGVLPNEILLDKISACSTDAVYKWRVKDLPDVYALSHCLNVIPQDLIHLSEITGREIYDFHAFYTKKDDVKHAYDKLQRISAKPDFEELYAYLSQYFLPYKDLVKQEQRSSQPSSRVPMYDQLIAAEQEADQRNAIHGAVQMERKRDEIER